MKDIVSYDSFLKIEPVNKGWSNDKKYYIENVKGKKLLLRVADISFYEKKKFEFEIMKKVASLGIPMSMPLEFGTCDNGKNVYLLLTWCDGEDVEVALPRFTETEQYNFGMKFGKILKLIHSIPAPKEQEEWSSRFNRKINNKIEKYKVCGIKIYGEDRIIEYIENNRYLLTDRPQCCQHGDYHVGNAVISSNDTLSIIDFNRSDFGDPWKEFDRIVWSAAVSPHFATGQINGYFGKKPSIEFFKLLAFYISINTLSSIYWSIQFGEKGITTIKNQAKNVLFWFDNMSNPVPTWYKKNL
jgi:serine/threonine-protein kinase